MANVVDRHLLETQPEDIPSLFLPRLVVKLLQLCREGFSSAVRLTV